MAHFCPFGAGDVTSAVAAGVSEVAARTLRKTWKLEVMRRRMKKMMMKRQQRGEDKKSTLLFCKIETNHIVEMRDCYL